MNKDFFTKPVSLKNIRLPRVQVKNIKNNKLIVICIFAFIFICAIVVIGSNLLDARSAAVNANDVAKREYNSLKNGLSIDKINSEMEKINSEMAVYSEKLAPVNSMEFSEILKKFRESSPIKLNESEIDVKFLSGSEKKENGNYDVYRVSVKSFSGTFTQIQEFLTYVENYEKLVRIDSLKFNKNKNIGNLMGAVSLSFYFKTLGE